MNLSVSFASVLFCAATLSASAVVTEHVDTLALPELVVTALKQSQNLKTLPGAATLVNQTDAQKLGIVNPKTLSQVVPNFYIPDYGSRITSSIYVRGLGARMDQPVVGLTVDNLSVLNKDAYDMDIPDIVRLEMLRGPQSALYGRNTMGGQLNITTLSPLDWQGGRVAATFGNGFDTKLSASCYKLLKENMGLSISAQYAHQDGWHENIYNGEKTDRQNSFAARAKFEWKPSNSFSMLNVAAFSTLNQSGYPYKYVETGKIEYNDTCFYRRLTFSDALTLRWLAPSFSISSISAVQYIDDNLTLDQDFLPLSYFTLTQKKREYAISQELIARNIQHDTWNRTSGLYIFYKHNNMQAPVHFLDYGIENLIEKHRNNANPTYPIEWDSRSFPLDSHFRIPTFGAALFHESNVNLGKWILTAGLRLDFENVSLKYNSFCNTGYNIFHDGVFFKHMDVNIDDAGKMSRHFLQLLPKIAALYQFDANNNVYINIAKGYKAGGYNTQMFSDILQQRVMSFMGVGGGYDPQEVVGYKPEKSWNFELGTHFSLINNKLSGQINAFYIDCSDQQLTMFPDGTTTGRIMTNAGKTRSFGAELQINYTPIRNLDFAFSYGYTNAKFREFYNGKEDFAGKYLPYAPQNTIFADASYALQTNSNFCHEIVFDLNLRATGKIYWNEQNSKAQNLYALLGASVTFQRDNASLQLYAQNLTNTKYNTFYFVSIQNEFLQQGLPLQCGASLKLNF